MTSKKTFGNRRFYSLPEEYPLRARKISSTIPPKKTEETSKLIKYIDENVIGKNTTFAGPYGRRKVVYCDYAASGRSLQFIEDYIMREVLPCYGNTHTTTSITSLQTTLYRHEARDIFRNAVHASEHDAVIFAGSGCTGAVHKLIHALNLPESPVVFVGPCEHHSNLLPWREIGSKIVRIRDTKDGHLDLVDLEQQLQAHQGLGPKLIGCFSAASNVTGVLADDVATTLLLHQYGALAFWDYATSAPYVKLDMNPILPGVDETAVHKDAMFFSVHKFVGGVQSPGVLIAKKALFNNPVPNGCGGGTVFFVSRDGHRYLQDTELREEGGTAAVVESVRGGLAMQLKEAVGAQAIMAREHKITRMVLAHMRTIPELILLGPRCQSSKRLPVFSFMVRHPRGTFLHHNFICTVLNDVFGIQARGGCACAGPYAQDLLGIPEDLAQKYEDVLLEDRRLDRTHLRRQEEHSSYEMLRPGFARISLPFFMADQEVAFVLEAIKMVATEGWKLLPQYILNPETGEWRHHTNTVFRERKWLGHIRYTDGKMVVSERRISCLGTFPQDYADCLHTARNIFNKARKMAQRYPLADQCVMFDEHTETLRWFMLPSEAQDLLLGHSRRVKHHVPFQPATYVGSRGSPVPSPASAIRSLSPSSDTLPRHGSLPCIAPRLSSGRAISPAIPHHRGSDHGRARCYSLGSGAIPPPLSPETAVALEGIVSQRSCGSQTDLTERSPFVGSPLHIVTSTPDMVSALGSPHSPEDIRAYVEEVTQSLATEIKSEIREVISKVDVLLSDSEGNGYSSSCDTPPPTRSASLKQTPRKAPVSPSQTPPPSLQRSLPSLQTPPQSLQLQQQSTEPLTVVPADSATFLTTDDVAHYIKEMSAEMASEVKSEIRDMVSQVDELLLDNSEGRISDISMLSPPTTGTLMTPQKTIQKNTSGPLDTVSENDAPTSPDEPRSSDIQMINQIVSDPVIVQEFPCNLDGISQHCSTGVNTSVHA